VNKTQIQTTIAPLIAAAAGFLAGKGVFGFDAATWVSILGAAGALGATVWGAVSARQIALKDTVGSMEHTTVVTTPEDAAALPNNKDVVAATPAIVNAVKAAQ
jgi:hypothetical protein